MAAAIELFHCGKSGYGKTLAPPNTSLSPVFAILRASVANSLHVFEQRRPDHKALVFGTVSIGCFGLSIPVPPKTDKAAFLGWG